VYSKTWSITLKREAEIQSPWDSLCDKVRRSPNERLRSAVESKLNSCR
jgi:hypothetical protein